MMEGPDSDAPFRRLVEGVRDYAIFLIDPEGHVLTWNEGARRIKGYSAADIIGRHISAFYLPAAVESRWPQHELAVASRVGRFDDEGWRVRKDGTTFWASVLITAIHDDNGELVGFSKITRDLTERRHHEEELRQSEERLRRSEERFRLLLEGVTDYAIFMLDDRGRVSSWNAGAQRITGYREDEIIGQELASFYPAEDVAAGAPAEELRAASLNRRVEARGWRVRKDGSRYWAEAIVTALHDDHGNLRGFAKVVRDLSEKKRMEMLEEEGRHLTEFLAMLAHELRNPLAPIRNAVAILSLEKDASRQAVWCRDVIDRQAVHLTRLVDDLLDVSRITRGKIYMQTATMDVNAAIHRAVEAARPLIDSRNHRLELDLSPAPLAVNGDLTRITQVVINLLNNAAKYTPPGGEIRVQSAAAGADALVRVIDNGEGIADDMRERVFDLFAQGERTLDRAEGGLGIGLTLARRIVALHGGDIKVSSAGVGKGAEFTVSLPLLR